MDKFCVFAGTAEGRELVEFLLEQGAAVTACVATEYGRTLLPEGAENLTISARRLSGEEIASLLKLEKFVMVVDATHPYARMVTEEIAGACDKTGTAYLRLLRGSIDGEALYLPDIPAAVEHLSRQEGNILLTTGSKELEKYAGLPGFTQRVYARVLPMEDSLRLCQAAGLPPSHILAMQGPFSKEMDTAMLRAVDARFLVTKDTGAAGGFQEKLEACREAGVIPVVIGRPPQREGLDLPETMALLCKKYGFSVRPKVWVTGIGPGGRGGMTLDALRVLGEARCVIGAARMLEAAGRPGQRLVEAITAEDVAAAVRENRFCRRIAVAVSGDAGFFSGAKKLLPLLTDCDVEVVPGVSSLVCLCARLGVSYEDVVPVSLHGRERDIAADVRSHRRIFALVGGENGVGKLCRRLAEAGLGEVRVSVGERLEYQDESVTTDTASALAERWFSPLSAVLVENARAGKRVVTHGLPDSAFLREEGVPMTKSEVRSVALSKLALTEDAVCWDIGAGTGSVSVEMALQARLGRVYAVEKKSSALALLEENRQRFYLENLTVVGGAAPAALEALPPPDCVFLGGSSGNLREILELVRRKNPSARIVAAAVTLETAAELTAWAKAEAREDWEAVALSAARSREAGSYHLMTAQNPVWLFCFRGSGRRERES